MNLKKNITFIYSDSAEKSIYSPLAEEAKKRGYKVRLTDDPYCKCEIGFYCQHTNFPQYSKFSLIMLHDIIQQYSNWPDLWFREPWNKYDIGILPSEIWANNWKQVSDRFYSRPRRGIYKIGWPKADVIQKIKDSTYKEKFYEEHKMNKNLPTVLYAPSWENDNKQDDFVQAMKKLDVNILIKQWDAPPEKFPKVAAEIERMRKLHENTQNVTILDPATNIFEAISVSEILVSEESSTMCEAVMMGIPAVSVSDWLIPDVVPSRLPKCDYDFVTKTPKADLMKTIKEILDNYDAVKEETLKYRDSNFSNIGTSSKMIMDIIDDCVEGNKIRYSALTPKKLKRLNLKKYLDYKAFQIARQFYANYCKRNEFLMKLWKLCSKIKHIIK